MSGASIEERLTEIAARQHVLTEQVTSMFDLLRSLVDDTDRHRLHRKARKAKREAPYTAAERHTRSRMARRSCAGRAARCYGVTLIEWERYCERKKINPLTRSYQLTADEIRAELRQG